MTARPPTSDSAKKPGPPSKSAKAERDRRVQEFIHLKAVKNDLGYIPGEIRAEAAARLGIHVEHLGREFRKWEKHGLVVARPGSTRKKNLPNIFDAQSAFFMCRGVISKTWELLRKDRRIPLSMTLKTFSRRVMEWDPAIRACARGGYRAMVKYQFFNIEHIPHKAYAYGMDHTYLPIMVVPERGTKPVFVWQTTLVDLKTRVVMAHKLSLTQPTAQVSLAVFIEGIRGWTAADGTFIGGKPKFLRTDRGGDFISHLLSHNLFNLDIGRQFTEPYSSFQNGRVEAINGTIDEDFAPKMPGFFPGGEEEYTRRVLKTPIPASSLLTLETLDQRITDWFAEYNNRTHSALAGMSPLQAWAADQTVVPRADSAAILNAMPTSHTRTLHKYGIEIRSRKYSHPTLAVMRKNNVTQVEVKYHEHDFDTIEVFVDGHHECTAIRDAVQPEHHRLGVLSVRRSQRLLAERLVRQADYDRVIAERKRLAEEGVAEDEWPPLPTLDVKEQKSDAIDAYEASIDSAIDDVASAIVSDDGAQELDGANVSGIPGLGLFADSIRDTFDTPDIDSTTDTNNGTDTDPSPDPEEDAA